MAKEYGNLERLTERIIGCAIEGHRTLGPGLLMNFNETSLRAGLKRLDHPDRYVRREHGIRRPKAQEDF